MTALATVTTADQPALFELEDLLREGAPVATEPVATVYSDADREANRELCQRYFRAWCGSFGKLDGSPAGHPSITREQFEAAAARLAEHADAIDPIDQED